MSKLLTAEAAARKLGISRRTLYAYVSRGLVRAQRIDGDARKRLYLSSDIEALAARKRQGRTPAAVGQAVLNWGVPVLASAISLVERGRLSYRGQDAVALAEQGATLEDTARLLWEMPDLHFEPFRLSPLLRHVDAPLRRAITALAAFHDNDGDSSVATCGRVLQAATAGLMGASLTGAPLHLQLARRWSVDRRHAESLRMALVLCADHELNASTFTVRCAASTGASLALAVCAGLAALSGPQHGGGTGFAADFIRGMTRVKPAAKLAEMRRRAPQLLCFGHPLYPDGDPRAGALIDSLGAPAISRLVDLAQQLDIPLPNIDFALGALEVALRLPRGSGFSIFAIGRAVGWIAHALEQQRTGALIRPRARYVGKMPG